MGRMIAIAVVMILLAALGISLMQSTRLKPQDCLHRMRPAEGGRFASVIAKRPDSLLIRYDDKTELRVLRRPRRVVSALPGITEIVAFLGGVERLVAVSPHCDTPPRVRGLRTLQVQPLDVESLLDVSPDLVILDRRLHRSAIPAVKNRVGNVLLLDTSRSLGHLRTSFDLLAQVLDHPEAIDRAKTWTRSLRTLEGELAQHQALRPPRVLIVAQWDPLYVLGPGSLLDDLVRACGFVNVACDLKAGASGPFSEELVLERRPAWILAPEAEMPDALHQRWVHVPAVADGRLVDAWTDDLVRGGPRILDGLAALAEALREPVPR